MDSTVSKILEEIEEERKEIRQGAILTGITLVGLLFGVAAGFTAWPVWVGLAAYAVAYLAGGLPAAKEAVEELFAGRLDINLLMVLAAVAAALVGEVRDGAILLFLFSLAGTLEAYAMGNTKRSIAALMELRPDTAHRLTPNGQIEDVRTELLTVGDTIVVRPGERLAADGTILKGAGAIDQSSVTGESVPVDKEVGDSVFAGTVNVNAVLHVTVTAAANHSTLARMIDLVTKAQESKAPSERFSDWFGQRYTIIVLLGSAAALGVFTLLGLPFDEAAYKAATLLVVASPCAIVISVPAAVLSALAAAARNGVLFKGGAALEQLASVRAMAFDKTGTMTEGKMQVVSVLPYAADQATVLTVACTVEDHSDHPLAKSIVAYAKAAGAVAEEAAATAVAGKGVIAKTAAGVTYWIGNAAMATEQGVQDRGFETKLAELATAGVTPVVVGKGANVLGIIGLADTLRESAPQVVAALHQLGLERVVMLSGDSTLVAHAIGSKLGLSAEDALGDLLPEDKVAKVAALQAERVTAFVGDGINDAAALATAEVGIAMGAAGSDVALEAADVALLSDDLTKITYAYKLSVATNRIIKQNLVFAVGIMILMIVVTLGWHLPLPLGVVGHEGGTLLVVANSLRLLFMKIS